MSGSQNWKPETGAQDYFSHQKRRSDIEQRRPVVRRASDLVGPGINAQAIVVTDWNDQLATYNGYFSSLPGATNAPDAVRAFLGTVVNDATLGGIQTVQPLVSGNATYYERIFTRNSQDATSITWGPWVAVDPFAPPAAPMVQALASVVTASVPTSTGGASFTTLTPPTRTRGSNDTAYYTYAASGWQITKSGLYLIDVLIGNTSGASVRARVQANGIVFPEPPGAAFDNTPRRIEHVAITAANLTSGAAAIFAQAGQATGASLTTVSYQLRISRLGEA